MDSGRRFKCNTDSYQRKYNSSNGVNTVNVTENAPKHSVLHITGDQVGYKKILIIIIKKNKKTIRNNQR